MKFKLIPISKLQLPAHPVRSRETKGPFERLVLSIKEKGILVPIPSV